jgi:hypothetical protein
MEENYVNRKFMIFNISELNKIDFEQVCETSSDTITKSNDGIKTFVKWDNDTPECVLNLNTKEGPYTYDEMLNILSTEEWFKDVFVPFA